MWDEFVDLISRPQQAVMGFSKEGSDQLGRTNQWISSKGYDPGYFGPYAVMSTIPAGLKGAWKGLTGQQDYNDWNLAEGATDNPKIDSAINTGVRMFADPAGLVPFGGQSQKAGTALRTAKNLWKSKWNNPEAYDKVTSGGLWNALKMDISHAGVTGNKNPNASIMEALDTDGFIPMVVRHDKGRDISGLVNSINPGIQKKDIGGTSFIRDNIMLGTTLPTSTGNVFRHEMLHNTMNLIPDSWRAKINRSLMEPLREQRSLMMNEYEPIWKNHYGKNYEMYMGEEGIARMFGMGQDALSIPSKPYLNEFVQKLWDVASKRHGMIETGAAEPLGYAISPSSVNLLRNAWNEE